MVNEQIVLADLVNDLAIVDGQILEARICGLDDDLRLESGASQRTVDAEDLVADGVAIAQRGQDLMNTRSASGGAAHESTGPLLIAETTFLPGRSVLRRCANQPGNGSSAGTGSRFNR